MRLATTAWFAAGCGLAVMTVVAGGLALDAVQPEASVATADASAAASLWSMTPAVDAETTTPSQSQSLVPIQRPRHLRESEPVAPPPPLPLIVPDASWNPDEPRLPPLPRHTSRPRATWNPDDPRMPEGTALFAAVRAYWNPDSATLPLPRRDRVPAKWNPDDPRLPER